MLTQHSNKANEINLSLPTLYLPANKKKKKITSFSKTCTARHTGTCEGLIFPTCMYRKISAENARTLYQGRTELPGI